MSLQFILGNSGSGKTQSVFSRILNEAKANPKKNYLIMAPEQSTIELQRKLVDLSPDQVIMNVDVLGFTRLAYRIFDELGMTALTVLEETGKNLVLRKVAQEKEQQLTVMRPNLNRMGYITELKSLLSEMGQYGITPERIQSFLDSGKLSPAFAAKMKDIQIMQKGFAEFMEGKYVTQEELLEVFCKVAKDSEILKNSVLVFDDYTGFTTIQNQVMRVLLPLVERVEVCLTMDAREAKRPSRGMQDLFDMPKQTIDHLSKLCLELGVEILPDIVFSDGNQKRFAKAPDLFWMEQNLFRPTYRRKSDDIKQIHMAVTRTPKEELLLAAREIHRLVKEENYHYGDIAVVTGNLEGYSNYVEGVFQKFKLPYFLDLTTEIVFHPFIEFIRASLEVVEQNFSYESVFRLLRTGFTTFEEDEIDRLENYCLAVGIRGKKDWSRHFARSPRQNKKVDLEALDQLRVSFYNWMEPLTAAFSKKGKNTVREQITVLYQLIETLQIEEALWAKEKQLKEAGNQAKAKEYEQIYGIVMALFDKIVGLLGDEELSIEEFIEIMDAGLSAAKVASLPPSLDTVIVGDIERTRLNHAKVLFFLGVNDGIIPKAGKAGGIISEYERTLLANQDMILAPGPREQVFIQKYYLYLNLTKPSEQLYISYASVDMDGKAIRPSYLIGTIKKMFPNLMIKECSDLEGQVNYATKESAMDYLIHGPHDENWYILASYLMQDEEAKEEVEKLLEAQFYQYEDRSISKAVAEAVYGTTMKASVTRLEQYAKCAYGHFLQYGLRLKEREESGFQSMDAGNIYHDALERYGEKLRERKCKWSEVDQKLREELSDAAFDEAVAEYPALTTYGTGESSFQILRMKRILRQTIWALTKQICKGSMEPSKLEVSFSQEEATDAVSFKLNEREKLQLTGRIDRLDTFETPEEIYVKVIDYKSGSTSYDLVGIYQGLQLQLVMYMNAAKEMLSKKGAKDVIPTGIFYYNIDEPELDPAKLKLEEPITDEALNQAILKSLRPNGALNENPEVYQLMDGELEPGEASLVIPLKLKKDGNPDAYSHVISSEQFQIMGDYVTELIQKEASEIYEGKVSVNPMDLGNQKNSCTYCPFQGVCQFDVRIPGFKLGKPISVSKEAVLDQMEMDLAVMKGKRSEEK